MPDLEFCVCGITAPCPSAATNLLVTNIAGTTATVAYTPNPNGSYFYDLSLVPVSGATILVPNIPTPYNASGLTAGTAYTPSIATRCVSGSAFRVTGSVFSTKTYLLAPQLSTPSSITATGFTVNWTASPHANQYLVNVYTNSSFTGTPASTGTTANLNFPVTGQTASTPLYYEVKAQDTTGVYLDSAYGTGTATTSSVVTLMAFSVQPTPVQTLDPGAMYTLGYTVVNGVAPFSYQLTKDGVNVGSPTSTGNYRNGGESVQSVSSAESGSYRFIVTDSSPTPQVITSNAAVVTISNLLTITQQPTGSTITSGNPFISQIYVAGGLGLLTFKLKSAGVVVDSSAPRTYRNYGFSEASPTAGDYTIEVSDSATTPQVITSNVFTLTINQALVAHYGFSNAAPATVADILAGLSQPITHNADITITWPLVGGVTNQTPMIYWMAQPSTEPAKLHSVDSAFPVAEPIGTNQTYGTGVTIGAYTLYHTGNPTSGAISTTFTNS